MDIYYADTNENFSFDVTVTIGVDGNSIAYLLNEDGELFESGSHVKSSDALAELFRLAHI